MWEGAALQSGRLLLPTGWEGTGLRPHRGLAAGVTDRAAQASHLCPCQSGSLTEARAQKQESSQDGLGWATGDLKAFVQCATPDVLQEGQELMQPGLHTVTVHDTVTGHSAAFEGVKLLSLCHTSGVVICKHNGLSFKSALASAVWLACIPAMVFFIALGRRQL